VKGEVFLVKEENIPSRIMTTLIGMRVQIAMMMGTAGTILYDRRGTTFNLPFHLLSSIAGLSDPLDVMTVTRRIALVENGESGRDGTLVTRSMGYLGDK
jgi:hypothetical protein